MGCPFAEIVWYPAYQEPKDPEGNEPKLHLESGIIILHPLERFYFKCFHKIYVTKNFKRHPETCGGFIILFSYMSPDNNNVWHYYHDNAQFKAFKSKCCLE